VCELEVPGAPYTAVRTPAQHNKETLRHKKQRRKLVQNQHLPCVRCHMAGKWTCRQVSGAPGGGGGIILTVIQPIAEEFREQTSHQRQSSTFIGIASDNRWSNSF